MAAAGAASQLRIAAGQLPDDALFQLCRRVPVQEGLQRAAAAAIPAHVDQLTWRQVSDALRKVRARFLAITERIQDLKDTLSSNRWYEICCNKQR